jgi:hypothetical protein
VLYDLPILSPFIHHPNILGEEHKLRSFAFCNFLHPPVTFPVKIFDKEKLKIKFIRYGSSEPQKCRLLETGEKALQDFIFPS